MPVPTIPLWGQTINNGLNNIRNIWKTAKERYNSMSPEQKAEAARVGNQWVTDNVLPIVTTVGELIPQTSIPMAAYNTRESVKKGNYEEAFQHALTPVLTGAVSKGVNLGLKASEKAIDTAGKALKNTDNYVTIQNALRTGKLRFGEPTTYRGIHQSKTLLTKVQFPFQRWDVTTHGADPNGFWLTLADSPNTTGTMASRPYASRWSATSQKPLIQTGEVKGLLGKKNNTRNAIVKYGRKHGADAFEFRGIRDNAIPQTDVVMVTEGTNPQYLGEFTEGSYISPKTSYTSIFMEEPTMSSSKGLTEAEKLGIPKSLRSDPRALEDPYYWGYKQWNQKYNKTVEAGNVKEAQRLRDLHFKIKAPDNKIVDYKGNPYKVYHGSPKDWYIFDDSKRGIDDVIYFSTDKAYADQYTVPRNQWKKGMIPTRNSREFYLYGKEPINIGSDMYYGSVQNELIHNWANGLNADSVYGLDAATNYLNQSSGMEFGVLRRNQFKLTNPITRTKTGEIIPIIKRDNFRNPDIRYKQGGKIKLNS